MCVRVHKILLHLLDKDSLKSQWFSNLCLFELFRPAIGKLHDSFDSDDSFDESVRKHMPPPSRVQPQSAKVTVKTTVTRQDSMSSTQSETQSEYRYLLALHRFFD